MLRTRIITAVIALLILGTVVFVLPPDAVKVVIGLLVLAGAWEWSGFLGLSSKSLRLLYVAIIDGLIATVVFAFPENTLLVLQVACAWWFLAFIWTLLFPTPIPHVVRWICGAFVLVPLFVRRQAVRSRQARAEHQSRQDLGRRLRRSADGHCAVGDLGAEPGVAAGGSRAVLHCRRRVIHCRRSDGKHVQAHGRRKGQRVAVSGAWRGVGPGRQHCGRGTFVCAGCRMAGACPMSRSACIHCRLRRLVCNTAGTAGPAASPLQMMAKHD